jgi:hypothetical protein
MSDNDEMNLEDLDPTSEDDEGDDESYLGEGDGDEDFTSDILLPLLANAASSRFRQPQYRPPQVARNRSYVTPRMGPFVTQPQLSAALSKVRADTTKNSAAITNVARRVAAVQAVDVRQNRALTKQAKINVRQSKDIVALRKESKKASDMALILFLLSRPKAPEESDALVNPSLVGGVNLKAGTKLLIDTGSGSNTNSINSLLPVLLLMGGLGGSSDNGSDSSNMLLLALALGGGL